MAGSVAVSLRKTVTRIPLSLPVRKRGDGDPAFRQAGWGRLTYRERVVADLVLAMYQSIPTSVLADYANRSDDKALGLAIGLALQPYQKLFEEELVEQYLDSGVHAAREWRKEISRGWARLGKAELPVPDSPSRAALKFEFDRASPTATKWATNESAKLINDLVDSQAAAVRAVVAQAFVDGRTYGTSASAIAKILAEVNPTGDIGKMLAEQYAVNTGGLFPRYGKAVANYAAAQAESLTKQGITGTKALETITKRSQRYADKLRRSRAKTIARTEIMRANNEGKLEAAYQAANKGLVDPKTAQRQWMTAPMDVCDICAPLHGVTVGLYESWYLGDPPAHPNCRCTFRLITNPQLYGVPTGTGSGTALSPARFTFPKLPKLDDDFLPGAPVIEPLPPVGTQPAGPLPETLPPDPMPGSAPEGPPWWGTSEEAKWGKWDDLAPEHQAGILDAVGGPYPGGLGDAIDDILGLPAFVHPDDVIAVAPKWWKALGEDTAWADLPKEAQIKLHAMTGPDGFLGDSVMSVHAVLDDLVPATVADDILTGSGGWFQPGHQQETLSNLDNIISPKYHHKNTPMAVRISDSIESVGGSPGEAKIWHDLTLPPGVKTLNPYDKKIIDLVYNEGKSDAYKGLKAELKKLVSKGQLDEVRAEKLMKEWMGIDAYIAATLDAAAEGAKIIDDDWIAAFQRINKFNQKLADELVFEANKGALLEPYYTKGSKWRLFIDDQIKTAQLWDEIPDSFTTASLAGQKPPVFQVGVKPLSDALNPPSSTGQAFGKTPTPVGVKAKLDKPSWFDEKEWGVKWNDLPATQQHDVAEAFFDGSMQSGQFGGAGLDADTAAKVQSIISPAADIKKPQWWTTEVHGPWDDIPAGIQQDIIASGKTSDTAVGNIISGVVDDDLVEGVPYWFDEDTFMVPWDDLPQGAKDDLANMVVSGTLDTDDALEIIAHHADVTDELASAPSWYDEMAAGSKWEDLPDSLQTSGAELAEMVDDGMMTVDEAMATLVDDITGSGGPDDLGGIVDDVTDEILEKLPQPDWFDEADWGKWDGKTAQQQHQMTEAVTEHFEAWSTPGSGDVFDIIDEILIPVDEIVDDLVGAVDEGLQALYSHATTSKNYSWELLDDLIEDVPLTPQSKNAPKKLKVKTFLDKLAETVGEGAVAPAYLDEIVLPPGMKNVSIQDFKNASWKLRKDFVKKGYLTQDEGDALAAALKAIEKRILGNADGLFTGESFQLFNDELIKFNQTLASRVKANTLANGTKVQGGSQLKLFMEAQEKFVDDFGEKVFALAEDAKSSFDDLLPHTGGFVNDLVNPIPPHLLSEAGAPSAVGIPKPKKPPAGYSIPEAKPLPGIKRPSQPADLPFKTGRLVEDKALGKQLSGQHPKQVYMDADTGRTWIFKPQEKWQAELDRATSELQRRLGLQGAETHVVTLNGQVGSIQEVIGGSFDDTVSVFAGKAFDPTKLSPAQLERMQQNQILDFLFSNHDAHADNFLRLRQAKDSAMLPIGIDKGQAFKHFGKTGESDSLVNWLFNPNANAPAKNPYGVMLEKFAAGEKVAYQFADESENIQQLIASVKELADSGELEKILKPYIDEAAAAGRLPPGYDADKMLAEIVDRWKNLGDDVKRLDEKLLKTKGGAVRTAEQQARIAADAAAAALEERVVELGMAVPSAFKKTTSAWANKVLKPITNKLSETSRKSVQRYTGSYYQKVNDALRGKTGTGGKTTINTGLNATDKKAIAAIDAAMSPLKEDIIVWRGTGQISDVTGKLVDAKNLEGTIIGDFGFQSSSVGDSAAFSGRTYTLKISVQKGVKAIYANPISTHKGEAELLLQRGLRMYVRGVEKRGGNYILDVVAIPDSVSIPGVSEVIKIPIYKQLEELWRSLVTA